MKESKPDAVAAMAIVLATRHGRESIERTLAALGRQSCADALELVIVTEASDDAALLSPDETARFAASRIVRLPAIASKAAANAAGARHATAAIVAFAEDHAFPEPDWADALLRGFADPKVAAVGPRVRNANPDTDLSWCDLVVNYGGWLSKSDGGPHTALPGFLCAYRRAALEAFDDRLDAWLEVENEMHRAMHDRGDALHYAPDAVVDHVNLSRGGPWLAALFAAGRIYAAERSREWSAGRRALYTVAWPAIPFVRLARLFADWPRDVPGLPGRTRLAPTLLLGLVADAAGQAAGFAMGAGDAASRLLRFEFGRAPYVRPAERALLEVTPR